LFLKKQKKTQLKFYCKNEISKSKTALVSLKIRFVKHFIFLLFMTAEGEVIAHNFYKSKNFLKTLAVFRIVHELVSVNFQRIPICK